MQMDVYTYFQLKVLCQKQSSIPGSIYKLYFLNYINVLIPSLNSYSIFS